MPRGHQAVTVTALACLALTMAGCTEVVDSWAVNGGPPGDIAADAADPGEADGSAGPADAAASGDQAIVVSDPCDPDPCALNKRQCINGFCGECINGFTEDDDGFCVPAGDLCDPDPCATVNKVCVNGFCGPCLEGYFDDGVGNCQAPSPCYPNPCTEPGRTTCKLNPEGAPWCDCDIGAHDDGLGNCTFDPCLPNPCNEPFNACHATGPVYQCGCPPGSVVGEGGCIDDPCLPNPCKGWAKTACEVLLDGSQVCACDAGFVEDEGGGCVEAPFENLEAIPAPDGDVVIDDSRQLFIDDWLVTARTNMQRRVHPPVRLDADWLVAPDPGFDIGRARGGSLVHVGADDLDALPFGHPLAGYEWRLYYLGYRQLWTFDGQPAWLCIAAASDPAGPWVKPELRPGEPAPHCVLRDDGLAMAEVSRTPDGFILAAMRAQFGDVAKPGLHMYRSDDGVEFQLMGGQPAVLLAETAVEPALYPRIGERSRAVYDSATGLYRGLFALPSDEFGDARGTYLAGSFPTAGWVSAPDALQAPAILGPDTFDTAVGRDYGDMAAWREGDVWIGLVQRKQLQCPRKADAFLVSSRDGQHWAPVVDEVAATPEAFLAMAPLDGSPDSSIDSLFGGAPAASDGLWHFFAGGTTGGGCEPEPALGGIVRTIVRAGGVAGLEVAGTPPAVVITRPLQLEPGLRGSVLEMNAFVADKLLVQVESLSNADTVTDSIQKILVAGDHRDVVMDIAPLNTLTEGRFRMRFTFTGGGELFGFRLSDPACTPNPCVDDPDKGTCDSSSGVAVCACNEPLHDDGAGVCTSDPCLPDPCTGPHEQGCSPTEDGLHTCGCEDGWVRSAGLCVPDPCLPLDGVPVCVPPGPNKCRAVDGKAECYCPDGSKLGANGCIETDSRAFVTSLQVAGHVLAGVAGGETLCNGLAAAAGLPGKYAAWLSEPGTSAKSRFGGGGPWRTYDPAVEMWTALVAKDAIDLTDGALVGRLDQTEYGATLSTDKCLVWTGTKGDGTLPAETQALGGHCTSWSSLEAPGFGIAGLCDATDALWTHWAPAHCSKELRVYCFELPPP